MKERPNIKPRSRTNVLRSVRASHSWRAARRPQINETQKIGDPAESLAVDSVPSPESTSASPLESDSGHYAREGCKFCHLPSRVGLTTVREVKAGATAGRQCCATILDAITTWAKTPRQEILTVASQKLQLDDAFIGLEWDWDFYELCENHKGAMAVIQLRWYEVSNVRVNIKIDLHLFQPEGSIPHETDIATVYKFPVRPLARDTSSLASAQRLSRWLSECRQGHPICRQAYLEPHGIHGEALVHPILPKRVLELVGNQVILRENLNSRQPYACLSHSWGPKGVSFKLQSSTIGILKEGVMISVLPKTFRDAVLVCLRLGIRFIWIDALCIIQDSVRDWEEAVANMADIYENGFLTIAATASKDSDSGCFSDKGSPFWPNQMSNSVLHVAQYRDRSRSAGDVKNFGNCPLLRRAWVFQERRLSTRIVHFAELQLIWECCSMWKSDSGHIDYDWTSKEHSRLPKDGQIPFKMPVESTLQSWREAVTEYSRLDLTHIKDRLPALAAIVKRTMRSRPDDTYIAGMWMKSMLEDLLWSRDPGWHPKARPPIKVPTWSWASVAGGVGFVNSICPLATLSDVSYCHIGPPQLGHVIDTSIVLRGPSCKASVSYSRNLLGEDEFDIQVEATDLRLFADRDLNNWYIQEDYDLSTGSRPVQISEDVSIIFVGYGLLFKGRWFGLILREFLPGQHERIGSCTVWSEHEHARVLSKAKLKDNFDFRLNHHSVLSLPVRQFKIV